MYTAASAYVQMYLSSQLRSPPPAALAYALFISLTLAHLLQVADSHRILSTKTLIAPPPSFYPRVIQHVSSATWLAAIETPSSSSRAISFAAASISDSPIVFHTISTIFSSSEAGADVANPHLLQLNSNSSLSSPPLLLCAFRHHSMLASPLPVYRIQIAASHDNGSTWHVFPRFSLTGTCLFSNTTFRTSPTDVVSGRLGVWEPFLLADGGDVLLFYAAELRNGGEQARALALCWP